MITYVGLSEHETWKNSKVQMYMYQTAYKYI
jgi:hypothetical protein